MISESVVLLSWNGVNQPLVCIELDAEPAFHLIVFDYSGRQTPGPQTLRGLPVELMSQATECKGEIYAALATHLAGRTPVPEYVALIDDDIVISIAQINRALHIARQLELDAFSPCLSHDSFYSHRWTLHRSHRLAHEVAWVEVMMPFYRGELFLAARDEFEGNVSSHGIDAYLMPTWQQVLGMTRTAVIDAVMVSHVRPITSHLRRYRNGRNAPEESVLMRKRSLALLRERKPELQGTAWYRVIFVNRHMHPRWRRLWLGLGRRIRRWLDQST